MWRVGKEWSAASAHLSDGQERLEREMKRLCTGQRLGCLWAVQTAASREAESECTHWNCGETWGSYDKLFT